METIKQEVPKGPNAIEVMEEAGNSAVATEVDEVGEANEPNRLIEGRKVTDWLHRFINRPA